MKFVILDRDGVINTNSPDYVRSAEQWLPLPGSIEAIAALSRAGFEIVIATNQSGLGRGLFGLDELESMHAKMRALVADAGGCIGAVLYCPHTPEQACGCRKPATGLLDAAELEYGCSLQGSVLVGDSLKDIVLARAKQCVPLLVLTGNGKQTRAALGEDAHDVRIFADLAAAATAIINEY